MSEQHVADATSLGRHITRLTEQQRRMGRRQQLGCDVSVERDTVAEIAKRMLAEFGGKEGGAK